MPLQQNDKKRMLDRVFNEPLSSETEAKRKHLLFIACFSILLAVYGVKVSKTPWLDLEVPTGAPNILHGAMATALVYTFITFALHAWSDLRRWHTASDLLHLHSYFDLLLGARNDLHAVKHWLDEPLPSDPAKVASIRQMHDKASQFFNQLEITVASTAALHHKLSAIQLIRLFTLDLGIPLLLGSFALYKIGSALIPFMSAIFK